MKLKPGTLATATRHAKAAPRRGWPALAAGASILIGACASTPPPTEQVAVATAAVANAVSAGGGEWAPAEMSSARDKLARANVAMVAKDNDGARALAEQAQVDAQLAGAKARAAKARKAAEEVQDAGRALREEMDRKTKQPQ